VHLNPSFVLDKYGRIIQMSADECYHLVQTTRILVTIRTGVRVTVTTHEHINYGWNEEIVKGAAVVW
jgi:hypothetical protein